MLLKNTRFYYCFIKFYHKSSAIATTILENLLKREISGNPRLFFTSRPHLTYVFASARYFACAQYDNAHLTRRGDYQSPAFNDRFRFREILHFVQNDKSEVCHPEHSEGSRGNEDAFNLTLPFARAQTKNGRRTVRFYYVKLRFTRPSKPKSRRLQG